MVIVMTNSKYYEVFPVLCAMLICLLAGCANPPANLDLPVVEVDVLACGTGKSSEFFGKPEVVVLETTPQSLIADISRLIRIGDRIYILDKVSKKISVFSMDGRSVFNIDKVGRGPGEYIQIRDFGVDTLNGRVVVMADVPMKVLYYDLEGNYLQESELSHLLDNVVCDNGREIYYNTYYKGNKASDYYVWFGATADSPKKLALEASNNFYFDGPRIVKSREVYFTPRYDYTLYKVRQDSVIPCLKFDFGENNMTQDFLDNIDDTRRCKEALQLGICHTVRCVRECEHFLMFKTNLGGFFIHDKTCQKTRSFNFLQDDETGLLLTNYFPHDADDNRMLFICFANSFIDFFNQAPFLDTDRYKEALNVSRVLKEDDNPVLFFYPFRR